MRLFGVSLATIRRYAKRRRQTREVAPTGASEGCGAAWRPCTAPCASLLCSQAVRSVPGRGEARRKPLPRSRRHSSAGRGGDDARHRPPLAGRSRRSRLAGREIRRPRHFRHRISAPPSGVYGTRGVRPEPRVRRARDGYRRYNGRHRFARHAHEQYRLAALLPRRLAGGASISGAQWSSREAHSYLFSPACRSLI